MIDFANREMSNVVLSLDGRKEIHDRYRVDYAGSGSWEKIVPKFQKLVAARGGKNGLRVNPLLPGRLLGRRRCGKEASLK